MKKPWDLMRILKQQKGISSIVWILILGLIIVVSIPAFKIGSIYINVYKINSIIKSLKSDSFFRIHATSPENVKAELLNRFELEKVTEITPDEIIVTPASDRFDVRVTHHYSEKIIMDKYFVLDVDESTYIPMEHPRN